MTDAAFITVQLCTTALTALTAVLAYKAKAKAEETHKAVNSRWDEFVVMAKASFRAEGVAQERQEEAIRQAAATTSRAISAAKEASRAKPKD